LTKLADLRPPLITVTRNGRLNWLWNLDLLTLARRSLVDRKIGERLIEENGTEYRIESARILKRARVPLFDWLVTIADPAVELDVAIVPTGQTANLDELRGLVLKNQDLDHNVSAMSGSAVAFRKQVERASDLASLFGVLKQYFPPGS
jgi:hypothetical protein